MKFPLKGELPVRHVARVILLDTSGAILLARYDDGLVHSSYWTTPGGALEPGETHRAAAARELREETGLEAEVGAELFQREFDMTLSAGRVHQVERYFLVQISAERPPVANSSPENIEELRWWTRQELEATRETVFPEGLVRSLQTTSL